ncbi:hypothetical protein MOK15_19615 [Sphingobium sp. BYY-5]|uniref:hypothetical protein n=1 Tax=Sphingobium sp. BYY-5 TaxID=2926400 RepID=UPI001FA7A3F6|nr:hypothetical protein [Sphingobium sp. BYY-5]MCI4592288.1 hypothetical protein [Sphingobium sp. BYY-5]
MSFFGIIALRSLTSPPLLTFGFYSSVMQACIGFVYIYSSLLHANLGGYLHRFGRFMATTYHEDYSIEALAVDKNFAIYSLSTTDCSAFMNCLTASGRPAVTCRKGVAGL